MSKFKSKKYVIAALAVFVLAVLIAIPVSAEAFVHGIVINVDGEDYYMAGAPDGPDGAFDTIGYILTVCDAVKLPV